MIRFLSAAQGGRRAGGAILAGTFVVALATTAFAIHMVAMPEKMQTKSKGPVERRFGLKLPLEQAEYHWVFTNREEFLAGRLALRITRGGKTEEIVIFEKGTFADGWDAETTPQGATGVYFGFCSTHKYMTAPGDEVEIELTVVKDLEGIGPMETGVLAAGTYRSQGAYSGLLDEWDSTFLTEQIQKEHGPLTDKDKEALGKLREQYEYRAFLQNWQTQWPLKITGDKGWLPTEQAAKARALMENEAKRRTERQESTAPR